MKHLLFLILLTPTLALAEFEEGNCLIDEESGLTKCFEETNNNNTVACPIGEEENAEDGGAGNFIDSKPKVPFCTEDQLYGKGKKMSPEERKKKEKQMRKLCKKKARNYKRSKAKEMLKKWNFFQALQIGLKSKRRIIRNSHTNETKSYNFAQYIDPEEVKNMNKKQFSQYVMEKIKKEVPNVDDLMKRANKKWTNRSIRKTRGYKKEETFLMNMVISSEGGDSCVMKPNEFPKEEEFTPEPCKDCDDKERQNNFTNDCSYMVTDKVDEKTARKWMGASRNKTALNSSTGAEDSHCNNKMEGVKNDSSKLDKAVDDLCSYAVNDYTPNMTIETSRNLFNDYTDNLAQKRGQFTKKYLYEMAKGKCKNSEGKTPDWLKNEEAFGDVVQVIHPVYAPNFDQEKADGNYGPNPYATGSQRDEEYNKLKATLDYEKNKKLTQYNEELAAAEEELDYINKKLNNVSDNSDELGLSQKYDMIKQQLDSDNADPRDIADMYKEQGRFVSEAKQYMAKKKEVLQLISDLKTKKENIDLKKYKMVNGEYELVTKLKSYYTELDNSPSAVKNSRDFKNRWNNDLFNDFKMARVDSDFKRINEFGIDEDLITPELSAMLKTLVEVDTYTCVLEPVKTLKFDAYLKAPLKVATGVFTPVPVILGGAGFIAGAPLVWTYDIFCEPPTCNRLGNIWPRFSDVFTGRRGRGRAKLDKRLLKEMWKAYISWGGKLDFDNWKLINEHKIGRGRLTSNEKALNQFDESVNKSACFSQHREKDKVIPVTNNESTKSNSLGVGR